MRNGSAHHFVRPCSEGIVNAAQIANIKPTKGISVRRNIHPLLSIDPRITIHGPTNGTKATPGALTPLRFATTYAGRDKPRKKNSRTMISQGPTLAAPTSIEPTIVRPADVLDRAVRAVRASPNLQKPAVGHRRSKRLHPSRFAPFRVDTVREAAVIHAIRANRKLRDEILLRARPQAP